MKETHGLSKTRGYRIWIQMRSRCQNPRASKYDRYGGRGIKVCDRWKDPAAFIADMGQPPSKRHEIDRIDNDGNYEPSNCRWATRLQQNQNRSDSVRITFKGQNKHIDEWAKIIGMSSVAIKLRIKNGMSPQEALAKPSRTLTYHKQHECAECGTVFTARRRLEKHHHAYCSTACYRKHRFGVVLTHEVVSALRKRRSEGASLAQLVREFGIHKSSVWRALRL
jgi:hypothetical protein